MNPMKKRLLAVASVAALGLSSVTAVSAPWGDCPREGSGYGRGSPHKGPMKGDTEQRAQLRQQRFEERMELLEARLELTDEQRASWQSFRAAMDAQHQTRGRRWQAKNSASERTAVQRFDDRVAWMQARLDGMKAVARAASELYGNLDEEQKAVMDDFFNRQGRGNSVQKGAGPRIG